MLWIEARVASRGTDAPTVVNWAEHSRWYPKTHEALQLEFLWDGFADEFEGPALDRGGVATRAGLIRLDGVAGCDCDCRV